MKAAKSVLADEPSQTTPQPDPTSQAQDSTILALAQQAQPQPVDMPQAALPQNNSSSQLQAVQEAAAGSVSSLQQSDLAVKPLLAADGIRHHRSVIERVTGDERQSRSGRRQ